MNILSIIAIMCGIVFSINTITLIAVGNWNSAMGWFCATLWVFAWFIKPC